MIKPLFTFASLDPGVSGGDGERLVDRAPVRIQLRGRGQVQVGCCVELELLLLVYIAQLPNVINSNQLTLFELVYSFIF